MKIFFMFILLSLKLLAFEAKVISVYDGDTVTVMRGENKFRIRLYGIDAPEMKQEYGKESRDYLRGLISNKTVRIESKGKDRYGRTIGKIHYNGQDINKKLLENGYAWYYRQFAKDEKSYEKATTVAQQNRRGIWKNKENLEPWKYREIS